MSQGNFYERGAGQWGDPAPRSCCSQAATALLTQAELLNDSTVSFDVFLLKVCKKVSSVTYHLKKTAAAVVILVVSLEVLVERVDSVCENRDLYLGRTCVSLVCSVSFNNCWSEELSRYTLSSLLHSMFTQILKHSYEWISS